MAMVIASGRFPAPEKATVPIPTTEKKEIIVSVEMPELSSGVAAYLNRALDTLDWSVKPSVIIRTNTEEEEEPDTTEVEQETIKEPAPKYYELYDYREDRWYHLDPDLQDHLREKCSEFGIEEYFRVLQVQLYVESAFQEDLISETNDHGIAQINECNFPWLRKVLGVNDFDDARQSILCQVYIMSGYLKDYPMNRAFSKYNTGQAYNETKYSNRILSIYNDGEGVREWKP